MPRHSHGIALLGMPPQHRQIIARLTDSVYHGPQWKTNYSCSGCRSGCRLMNDASGSFSDGSGTANYANNANCQWMIAPPGATRITLRFPEFSTQTRVDFVRVYQCTDVYCSQQQQLVELSGRYPVVQGLTSTTGFVKVVFTSDGSVSFDGFTAAW
jgi:hypothetical protein